MSEHWGDEVGRRGGPRSLFWPVVLISAGALFLLDNLGVLAPGVSAWDVMLRFWPLILILIGIDILFGRSTAAFGRLVGAGLALALVFGVMLLALAAPAAQRMSHERWTLPAEGVARATLTVNFADYGGRLTPLRDSTNLIEADVSARGGVRFEARTQVGQTDVTIAPERRTGALVFLDPATWFGARQAGGDWDIRLSEAVAFESVALEVDDGRHDFDMTRLRVRRLTIEGDDATIDVRLPDSLESGRITLDDGAATIRLPELPSHVGVQIVVELDDGTVSNERGDLSQVQAHGNGGTWQTANYGEAERRILLEVRADDARIRFE